VELAFQFPLRQQVRPVAGHVDTALLEFQQGDVFRALARAQDHAQRFSLVWLTGVPLEPAQIEFHLAFVRGLELADLQVNGDQATESSMIEE